MALSVREAETAVDPDRVAVVVGRDDQLLEVVRREGVLPGGVHDRSGQPLPAVLTRASSTKAPNRWPTPFATSARSWAFLPSANGMNVSSWVFG